MLPLIKGAASSGAQIIRPAGAVHNRLYLLRSFSQDRLIEGAEAALGQLILQCADIGALVIVGLPVRVRGRLFNCAAAFQNGNSWALSRRAICRITTSSMEGHFVSGLDTQCDTVTLCGQECRSAICSSARTTAPQSELSCARICGCPCSRNSPCAQRRGYDGLNISASDEMVTKNDFRLSLIEQTSARCYCGYVYSSPHRREHDRPCVLRRMYDSRKRRHTREKRAL